MARTTAQIVHNAERASIVRKAGSEIFELLWEKESTPWRIDEIVERAIDEALEARQRHERRQGGDELTRSCGCPWCDRCEW